MNRTAPSDGRLLLKLVASSALGRTATGLNVLGSLFLLFSFSVPQWFGGIDPYNRASYIQAGLWQLCQDSCRPVYTEDLQYFFKYTDWFRAVQVMCSLSMTVLLVLIFSYLFTYLRLNVTRTTKTWLHRLPNILALVVWILYGIGLVVFTAMLDKTARETRTIFQDGLCFYLGCNGVFCFIVAGILLLCRIVLDKNTSRWTPYMMLEDS